MKIKRKVKIIILIVLLLLITLSIFGGILSNNDDSYSTNNPSEESNTWTQIDLEVFTCRIFVEGDELAFEIKTNVALSVICNSNNLEIVEYNWMKEGEGVFIGNNLNFPDVIFSSDKLGENQIWAEILLVDGSEIKSNIIILNFGESGDTVPTDDIDNSDTENSSSSNSIPPVTTPIDPPVSSPITPPNNTRVAWNEISSWAYQLQNYSSNSLDQIKNSKFSLVVIDLSNNDINGDGIMNEFWSNNQVKSVKDSGKYVLAYFEIGAIEDFRPEYSGISQNLLLWELDDWEGEFYVKYWEEEWWTIVKGRVDQAILAGFDGAYLDMVVSYEHLAEEGYGTYEENAVLMVDLIVRISNYAKSKNSNFKIVPQNSPELITIPVWGSVIRTVYSNAIDGIGMEEMYVLAMNKSCTAGWCQDNIDYATEVLNQGKIVLSIDYSNRINMIYDVYKKSRAAGFIPYVSILNLDALTINDCSSYNYTCDPN